MVPSRFNIAVEEFPGPGRHLLYNTRSQAQVVIDDELRAALAALPAGPSRPETAQAFAQLEKLGFVVSSAAADDAALEAFFQKIHADRRVLYPTILTTYACNLACVYCVEQGLAAGAPMSVETAERAADYVVEQLHRFGSREIHLTFYGGEPLLNLPAVRAAAARLRAFAGPAGVPFRFDLSTNGALLTRDVAEELSPLGLRAAKITLDGPRDLHDRYRPFRTGKGSFDTLVGNIAAVADLVMIRVEINVDGGNVDRVGELLDALAGAGLRQKIERLVFNPIVATPRDRELLKPGAEAPCAFMSTEYVRRLIALRRLSLAKGFTVDTGVEAHACELVSMPTHFIVDPRGALSRCGGLVGRPEFAFGALGGPEDDHWMDPGRWRRCASCAFAPQCGEGCPLSSWVRHGDPRALDCEKEAMELLVRESLRLSYELKRSRPTA